MGRQCLSQCFHLGKKQYIVVLACSFSTIRIYKLELDNIIKACFVYSWVWNLQTHGRKNYFQLLGCFDVKLSNRINSDESNGGFIWENCSSYIFFLNICGKTPQCILISRFNI